eukprot:COSAG05_NODE_3156_length_2280_cov_2.203576_3_plen_197_part_00
MGNKIGEGGGGIVYSAIHRDKGLTVAVKRIHQTEGTIGVTVPALREIKFLQELRHENVIELFDVFKHEASLYLVFPLMPSDLEKIIGARGGVILQKEHIKAYMQMIAKAVGFLHANWVTCHCRRRHCRRRHRCLCAACCVAGCCSMQVLHRDIKPDNFLVAPDGTLKLTDLGLSKGYGSPLPPFSAAATRMPQMNN